MDLYGSYAYNVDVSDGEFTSTRENLEYVLTTDAESIFSHYIDKIIRVDAQQSADLMKETKAIAPDEKMVFNTFFAIGSKLVPSSAILFEIIDALRNGAKSPTINFNITDLMVKEGAP